MRRSSLLALAFLVVSVHLFQTQIFCQSNGSQPRGKQIELRELLRRTGDKFDCYFTMEIGLISGDHRNSIENISSIEGKDFSSEPQEKSLRQELEWLRRIVPNLSFEFDNYNPQVIHIIDLRLLQEKNYAMGVIVNNIRFDGTLSHLVNAIGEKGVSVSSRGAVDTREFQVLDYSTKVNVKEENKTVRDILTRYLILKGRARVLWIAETELGRNQTTYVRYLR